MEMWAFSSVSTWHQYFSVCIVGGSLKLKLQLIYSVCKLKLIAVYSYCSQG